MIREEMIVINSKLADTYKVAEHYPEFVDFYTKGEIVSSNDKESHVKLGAKFFGIEVVWEGIGTKNRNQAIHWTQTSGTLRGMKVDWLFFEMDSDTKVVIKAVYEARYKFLEPLADFIFLAPTLPRLLSCLKKECERVSRVEAK